MQNSLARRVRIQSGTGRVVFVSGVNSGSRSGPPLRCPGAAQGNLGPAGASAFAVSALGESRLRGVGHVVLSRRTPYRVSWLKRGGQPANQRMDPSSRGARPAGTRSISSPRLAAYARALACRTGRQKSGESVPELVGRCSRNGEQRIALASAFSLPRSRPGKAQRGRRVTVRRGGLRTGSAPGSRACGVFAPDAVSCFLAEARWAAR